MKLLLVASRGPPEIGGIERVVEDLGRALARRGHQVRILCRLHDDAGRVVGPGRELRDGVEVQRVRLWGPRRAALAPELWRELSRGRWDRVFVHTVQGMLFQAALVCALRGVPFYVHSHGFVFHEAGARWLRRMYFRFGIGPALRLARQVLCDSAQDEDLAREVLAGGAVRRFAPGVDAGLRNPGVARDPDLMVGVGRHVEHKRHHLLVRALAGAPGLRLELVGPGVDDGELAALAARLGVADRVRLRGTVPDPELREALGRAGLFVSASRFEGFGMALLEAMAHGCVPVVQDIPSHRELVAGVGELVDFEDPGAVAGALERARGRGPEDALARAGEYDWERRAQELEELVQGA